MTSEATRLVSLTAEIVSAHVTRNTVAVSDLPLLIGNVYTSLAGLGAAPAPAAVGQPQPAVSIRASIKPDYIVCLEDGKQMKMLKRHLMTDHQMTPDEYRAKWKLPADYPMVASKYAASRRTMALNFGLGKRQQATADAVPDVVPPAEAAPAVEARPVSAEAPKARQRRSKTAVSSLDQPS